MNALTRMLVCLTTDSDVDVVVGVDEIGRETRELITDADLQKHTGLQ